MKKILLAGVVGLAAIAAAPAMAEPNGPYVAGDIGYHWPSMDVANCSIGGCVSVDVDMEGGLALFGRFGTRINSNFRIEAELGRRWGSVDTISGTPLAANIDTDATSLMANVLYDFGSGRARPFVGAGVGWGQVEVEYPTLTVEDSGLAWQLLAGLAVSTGPRGNIDITYRYFNVNDLRLETGASAWTAIDYADHAITIGYRHSFGAIAAPPPPAASTPSAAASPAASGVECA